MEKNAEEVPSHQAKKRKSMEGANDRREKKKKRYSSNSLPQRYPCRHNGMSYKCVNISMQDVKIFNEQFYKNPDKQYQDDLIIKYCKATKPSRKRLVNGRGNSKSMSIVYNIRKVDGEIVPVCRIFFLRSLVLNKGRVRGVLKGHMDTGFMAIEKRGGDRKSFKNIGHSFIPPDRVFGVAEKAIKKTNTLVQPEEYINIFKRQATVFLLNDIKVCDWKNATHEVQKGTQALHFKIMSCKRFIFTRMKGDRRGVILRGEIYYHNDTCARRSITKPGKFASDICPVPITPISSVKIKKPKLSDVEKLLTKHYGREWAEREELSYYKAVIERYRNKTVDEEEIEDEVIEDGHILCEEYVEDASFNNLI
ncbi:unnamed protein product [Arctia plantaginis]|uniref:Uncharacterized protein n=1 Tax=Arctia plantaginis TaxID=874455 RepID=A0A8S1AAF8_ARCPL|nr:unnamed protein product [Arctia plantaginis]